MGLRYKKANVTHPELSVTVQIPIISVKKNPQNPMYTQLGVLTKGTIVEVNVSELGIVTAGGKVVWGRWAQVTNNPENDGCVNAWVVFFSKKGGGGREEVADFFVGFYLFDSMQETEKMHSAVFFLRVEFHAGYKDIMMARFTLRIRE